MLDAKTMWIAFGVYGVLVALKPFGNNCIY